MNRMLPVVSMKNLLEKLCQQKRRFFKAWIITFVLSCIWIFPQPRYYYASVKLAPEINGAGMEGSLSSLASSFGVNLNSGVDALYPSLYPDLISSNDFIVDMFAIPVRTLDGSIETDLFTYLSRYRKKSIYTKISLALQNFVKSLFPKEPDRSPSGPANPFFLTKRQNGIVQLLKSNISCMVDQRTDVFTIRVKDQDPLVAATLADSVKSRLQAHIVKYRTSKARVDEKYYEQLCEEAKAEYEKSLIEYSRYVDEHQNVMRQSTISQRDRLENEVGMKLEAYNTICTQLQASKAKVQEKTPAFTVLQNASVPLKAAGPKRMFFVFVMLFLVSLGVGCYVLQSELVAFVQFLGKPSGTK